MGKLIKPKTEQDREKLWDWIVSTPQTVNVFGASVFEIDEQALSQLRRCGVAFEVIEPDEWVWQNGEPVKRKKEFSHRG